MQDYILPKLHPARADMSNTPQKSTVKTARALILQLKSTMNNCDSDGNVAAMEELIFKSGEIIIPTPFTVLDFDMPTDEDRNSYRCFWTLPIGCDPCTADDNDESKVVISPETPPELFDQLLSYIIGQIIVSYQEKMGFRTGLYINAAYVMILLFEGVETLT